MKKASEVNEGVQEILHHIENLPFTIEDKIVMLKTAATLLENILVQESMTANIAIMLQKTLGR